MSTRIMQFTEWKDKPATYLGSIWLNKGTRVEIDKFGLHLGNGQISVMSRADMHEVKRYVFEQY